MADEEGGHVPEGGRWEENGSLSPKAMTPKQLKKRSLKVCCLWCCCISSAVILLLVIILVILIFTVYKKKDPTLQVDSVRISGFNVDTSGGLLDATLNVTLALDTNVTIYNPNRVSFKYENTTALVTYHDVDIAMSPIASGKVSARKRTNIELPIDISISTDDLGDLTSDLFSDVTSKQILPLVTTVTIRGTAKVAFIKIKHIRVRAVCNVNYFIFNGTQSFDCKYKVKI